MAETVTVLSDWLKTHPHWHSRLDISGDHIVLTLGPKSPELIFPAWMWLVPAFWPTLIFYGFFE
jgi:hypothetical protein